ncbi:MULTISPECIES: hypothetical protein [Pandoraea]|nr:MULTISPECIES: hypothetical protein [Pandoraea]
MAETLIKVDLNQSAYENEQVHNRWHPDCLRSNSANSSTSETMLSATRT